MILSNEFNTSTFLILIIYFLVLDNINDYFNVTKFFF